MIKKTKLQKAQDRRIELAYYDRCDRITIPIMETVKVFNVGRAAFATQPDITDAELGDVIAAYVDTIKVAA
jgi:hypothetical protein